MQWQNTRNRYGLIAVFLHWALALLIPALFGLGLWMTGLPYFDPWALQGPALHGQLGLLAGLLFGMRLVWRLSNPRPFRDEGDPLQQRLVRNGHRLLYALMALGLLSGLWLLLARGQPLTLSGWVLLPDRPLLPQAWAGPLADLHRMMVWGLMLAVLGHVLLACKHAWRDGVPSFSRIFGRTPPEA